MLSVIKTINQFVNYPELLRFKERYQLFLLIDLIQKQSS